MSAIHCPICLSSKSSSVTKIHVSWNSTCVLHCDASDLNRKVKAILSVALRFGFKLTSSSSSAYSCVNIYVYMCLHICQTTQVRYASQQKESNRHLKSQGNRNCLVEPRKQYAYVYLISTQQAVVVVIYDTLEVTLLTYSYLQSQSRLFTLLWYNVMIIAMMIMFSTSHTQQVWQRHKGCIPFWQR